MSLAMYAAPFDNDINQTNNNNNNNSDTLISKKKLANNKTQKRYPKENINSERVNSVLQTLHNLPDQDESLADFNPIPPPSSAGVERKENSITSLASSPMPYSEQGQEEQERTGYSFEDSSRNPANEQVNMGPNPKITGDYYSRFMPNYNHIYKNKSHNIPQYMSHNAYQPSNEYSGGSSDVLIEKLNYMINLLEEQKDEKTGSVTEEVILYSFLGIFIIFIVDSFVRVGKYVR